MKAIAPLGLPGLAGGTAVPGGTKLVWYPGAEYGSLTEAGGGGEAMPLPAPRQFSQESTSRIGPAQTEHIAFPQLRQKPVASTSGWTAHFIEFSLPNKWDMRPRARWSARPNHWRDSAVLEKLALNRPCFLDSYPMARGGAAHNPDCPGDLPSFADVIGFKKRQEDH